MSSPVPPPGPYGYQPQDAPEPGADSYGAPPVPNADPYGAPPAPTYGMTTTDYSAPPAYSTPAPAYSSAPAYGATPTYGGGYGAPAAGAPTNTMAIISLVLSIIGFGLVGAILGHMALKAIKTSGESGHGLALAGVIIGWLGVAVGVIVSIFWTLIWIGALVGSGSSY